MLPFQLALEGPVSGQLFHTFKNEYTRTRVELCTSFQEHLGDRKHPDLGTNQCMEKAEN